MPEYEWKYSHEREGGNGTVEHPFHQMRVVMENPNGLPEDFPLHPKSGGMGDIISQFTKLGSLHGVILEILLEFCWLSLGV